MEIIVKGVRFDGYNVFYISNVVVSERNCDMVRLKLLQEHEKIINKLKEYKKLGKISGIKIPRDVNIMAKGREGRNSFARKRKTEFQLHLNELVKAKKEIKREVEKIEELFLI